MTDYPTRAEIDAAADTLFALVGFVDKKGLTSLLAEHTLRSAWSVLYNLDAVPGLYMPEPKPEPEHEPQPQRTPAQVLEAAWSRTEDGSTEESIIEAAWKYAVDHPEWFDTDLIDTPVDMLESTAEYVFNREPEFYAILAAYHVAKAHPELFGGAA